MLKLRLSWETSGMSARRRPVLAIMLGLCVVSPAFGQAQAPIDDPEADVLPDVLVMARTPGPAWWRVSRGESVVWIMGSPSSPTPKGMTWDDKTLERRLTGANALLAPPTIFLSFPTAAKGASAPPALQMTPALVERFDRARKKLGKPARRYARATPSAASFALYKDFLSSSRLEWGTAIRRASAVAKARGVPVIRAEALQAGRLRLEQSDPALPGASACYTALIEATEASAERYRAAAIGWARGDPAAAISAPRHPYSICDNRLFNEGGIRRAIEVQTAAIKQALSKPGKSVAVIELRRLLAEEGILARLKSEGYTVVSPNETESPD